MAMELYDVFVEQTQTLTCLFSRQVESAWVHPHNSLLWLGARLPSYLLLLTSTHSHVATKAKMKPNFVVALVGVCTGCSYLTPPQKCEISCEGK